MMNSFTLKSFLTTNLDVSEAEISSILASRKTKKVRKDQFLLRENEISRNTFFVEKGLLRQFSIDKKGKEHTLHFAPENWFVAERESAYCHQPSVYSIQALEDSELVLIDETFIQELSHKIPGFSEFNNRLLHNHIRHLEHRINLLLSASAEERYLKFIEMYPDILLRVPQIMVSSYLGITPESLSRVRKELAQKNFKI